VRLLLLATEITTPVTTTDPACEAVLFDRDGTLVVDVPYNGDPALVQPVPTAAIALQTLRHNGIRVGVVTNQSGVATGLLSTRAMAMVNDRIEQLLGAFDVWRICVHDEGQGCPCRKPAPGMVVDAAYELGIPPRRVVVVGDIGRDVHAGLNAGARAILVPTQRTRRTEIDSAPVVAADLLTAVRMVLR